MKHIKLLMISLLLYSNLSIYSMKRTKTGSSSLNIQSNLSLIEYFPIEVVEHILKLNIKSEIKSLLSRYIIDDFVKNDLKPIICHKAIVRLNQVCKLFRAITSCDNFKNYLNNIVETEIVSKIDSLIENLTNYKSLSQDELNNLLSIAINNIWSNIDCYKRNQIKRQPKRQARKDLGNILNNIYLLVSAGANPNIFGINEMGKQTINALGISGLNNSVGLATLLIKKGAVIDATCNNLGTPLVHAINFGSNNIAKLLISNGANIHYGSFYHSVGQFNILRLAIYKNLEEIVALLISHNVDLNNQQRHSRITALITAIQKRTNLKMVLLLLANGANPNITSTSTSPLVKAIEYGNVKLVELLLKYGANPNYTNKHGNTSLYSLIYSKLIDESCDEFKKIVNLLLQYKANPNVRNKEGDTPLILIAKHANCFEPAALEEITKLLIAHGAKVRIKNNDHESALDIALTYNDLNLATILLTALLRE